MCCYFEFKLRYLKNLKLFSIRVKELFEPTVLQKTNKQTNKQTDRFLLFLKAFSWETNLWVTLGDFTVKRKIGEGNLYSTETRLGRNKMWCAEDNHSYMCHICAKGFLDSNFNEAVIDKNIHFSRKCPKFLIFTQIINFKVQLDCFRPTASTL